MPTYGRTVQVRWVGLDKLKRMLSPNGNAKALDYGLTEVALDVESRAKDNAPVQTARLSRSIRLHGRRSGPVRVIIAGSSSVRYAAAKEEGSGLWGPKKRKYPIVPRKGKFLRFPSQQALTQRAGARATLYKTKSGRVSNKTIKRYGNKAFVVTRKVMHPGSKGYHYMKKAIESSPMADIMAKAMVTFWRRQ